MMVWRRGEAVMAQTKRQGLCVNHRSFPFFASILYTDFAVFPLLLLFTMGGTSSSTRFLGGDGSASSYCVGLAGGVSRSRW